MEPVTASSTEIAIVSFPNADPSLIDMFSALLVPVIALLGAFIAYQQYVINKQRLRHETYERRLAVYRCVQKYLSFVVREGKSDSASALEFYQEASEAAFLFDDSVQTYIEEIFNKSLDLISNKAELYPENGTPGLPIGPERQEASARNSELVKWHYDQLKIARDLFRKKLGLKAI